MRIEVPVCLTFCGPAPLSSAVELSNRASALAPLNLLPASIGSGHITSPSASSTSYPMHISSSKEEEQDLSEVSDVRVEDGAISRTPDQEEGSINLNIPRTPDRGEGSIGFHSGSSRPTPGVEMDDDVTLVENGELVETRVHSTSDGCAVFPVHGTGKKSVARKSPCEVPTVTSSSSSHKLKMFPTTASRKLVYNIDDCERDEEDSSSSSGEVLVENAKVNKLSEQVNIGEGTTAVVADTSRSTTRQSYASYRSGSLQRGFSTTLNFFNIENAPSSVPEFVNFCREQQVFLVQVREKENDVTRNRCLIESRLGSASNRFNGAWASLSSISRRPFDEQAAKTSCRSSLDSIRRDYHRMVGGLVSKPASKKSSSGRALGNFRAFAVEETIIPSVGCSPLYSAWIPLHRPISCEDDPLLRYVCYFGEHDDEDVMADVYDVENVDTQGKNEAQEKVAEMYEHDDAIIEQFLLKFALHRTLTDAELRRLEKALTSSRPGVVSQNGRVLVVPTSGGARGPKDTTEPDANESFSARCTRLLNSLRKRMDVPLHEIRTNQKRSEEHELMDTFRSLFCRICFVYDCSLHGGPDISNDFSKTMWKVQQAWSRKEQKKQEHLQGTPCSCESASTSTQSFSPENLALCRKALVVCKGSSCEAARLLRGVATCAELKRLSRMFSVREGEETEGMEEELGDSCYLDVHSSKRIAQVLSNRSNLSQYLKSLLNSETSKRLVQEAKQSLLQVSSSVPCYHFGPCTTANGCSCAIAGSFCTKHCMCSVYLPSTSQVLCKNFFPGCRCSAGCETKSCPCYSTSRCCDRDLCLGCNTMCNKVPPLTKANHHHHHEMDKQHRAQDTGRSAENAVDDEPEGDDGSTDLSVLMSTAVEKCRNRIQSFSHLLLAESEVQGAGWGIFARNRIAQGDVVAEYLGEVVSQEEAERRGRYYDKVNRSYLFNVNADQVVDAFRKGNKIKFANHSKKPNCEVKVLNIERQQRIIFFAKKDIEPGEELFFDYHYEQEQNSAHVKKNGVVVDWMRNGKRANTIRKRPVEAQLIRKADGDSSAAEAASGGGRLKKKAKVA